MSGTRSPFEDLPVLGELPANEAAAKLRELGEDQAADTLTAAEEQPRETFGTDWLFGTRAWQHLSHRIGHLAPTPPGRAPLPVLEASAIAPDTALKGARVKLTLGRLFAADYPGRGIHRVLVDVAARDQTAAADEHLHFAATYEVRDGEAAGVMSYPIFVGLPVSGEGLVLGLVTVNVGNQADERFLSALESDVFRTGLQLLETWQPALVPLSGLVVGLTRALVGRTRNVAVQKFVIGLDFGSVPGGLRLAEGTYVAVQIPKELELVWDWDEWMYDPGKAQLVARAEPSRPVPFNYITLGVSRYHGV